MREVYDAMRHDGLMGGTTAEMMARLGKHELSKEDREVAETQRRQAKEESDRLRHEREENLRLKKGDRGDEWLTDSDQHEEKENYGAGKPGDGSTSRRSELHASVEDVD